MKQGEGSAVGADMETKKTKNKDFLKWMRAESCFRKDNIVSTDWHERLEKVPMFEPTYAKCRPDMYQIMSMEYGRMWHREKEDWFSQIFKPDRKRHSDNERRKKLRREFLEAKRKADIQIKERKERVAKEREAKAKADAEAHEKAKRAKARSEKRPVKKKEKKEKKSENASSRAKTDKISKKDECPEGWNQVELTVQCECEANRKEKPRETTAEERTDFKTDCEREASNDGKEEVTEAEVAGSMKKEGPCEPVCMPLQIAQAVEKSLEGDAGGNEGESQVA